MVDAATLPSGATPVPLPTTTPETWQWTPLPAATASFVPSELVIQKLRVRAPIEVKGVDANNQMQAPDRPTDAAWYRFTARPGSGSNAVFAGHRDFAGVGPAIFWRLDQLAQGDLVEVASDQRTEIRYLVTAVWDYRLDALPMDQVLAPDQREEITLITCSGRYASSTGYDHRLVVRAVRVA